VEAGSLTTLNNSQAPGALRKPKSLDAAVLEVSEISTLPQVALQVMAVVRDPNTGAADLIKVVEGDPALSARVLRLVNSAAYSLCSKVNNLHQAITYAGFHQVRNLAITASVAKVFRDHEAFGTYKRSMLWRHMISVGVCARLVARRCRLPDFEDAFLAGLLHDIGIILLDQHLHDAFAAVINDLTEEKTLVEVEQEHLGFDHTQFGERVATKWGFPPRVCAAIRYHHQSLAYLDDGADIVRCVEVANVLCTLKNITSVGRKLVTASAELFQSLSFQKHDVVVLAADLGRELAQCESLFKL
jgi:putative nucleotidyltransferase with HDIG domain